MPGRKPLGASSLCGLLRSAVRRVRPSLVNRELTDAPVVAALRRAADVEAVVAVYDDGAAPHATPETLERELGVAVPPERDLRLPSVPSAAFGSTRRTVRAVALRDADPPVVLVSRRSLRDWDERTRNFVLAHEFGHLLAESPERSHAAESPERSHVAGSVSLDLSSVDALADSLLPAPDRSALAVRALVAAYREFRAGEAHAWIRRALADRRRASPSVAAEYHDAERAGEASVVLSSAEQRALEIRNTAKYLPLAYDPPGVGESAREALRLPFPRYLDWVVERPTADPAE